MILATSFWQSQSLRDVLYIVAFSLFIQGLRGLSGPTTAVRGNRIAAVGMGIAVIATLLNPLEGNWGLIALGLALGTAVGVPAARQVRMTAMPQMVALFNGMGGGSAALIAAQDFRTAVENGTAHPDITWAIMISCLIGSISFTGSLIAFAKLQELMPGRPLTYPLQKPLNGALLLGIIGIGVYLVIVNQAPALFGRLPKQKCGDS